MSDNLDNRSLEEIIPPEGVSNEQVKLEVMDLERAHNLLSSSSTPAVNEAKIINPISRVEIAVANYIEAQTQAQVDHRNGLTRLIEQKIASKLDSMNIEQLLGLYGTERVTQIDEMSKFLSPVGTTINTAQQAKIAEETRLRAALEKQSGSGVQVNIGNVGANPAAAQAANEMASKEVLQGLTMISQLIEAQNKMQNKKVELTEEDQAEANSNKVSEKDI